MPDISVLSGTNPTTVFLICFFLHIVADFNLQGMLKDLKQKSWWEKNYPNPIYKDDWRCCMWLHCYAWAILTFLPFVFWNWFSMLVILNASFHFLVDHAKANVRPGISLSFDQMLHIGQICATVYVVYGYAL